MIIKSKSVESLKPAPYNPRVISDKALDGLGASIDRWGIVQPIVWNERTGHVVGGHQRLDILLKRGVTQADVVVVDLPESEEKALNLSLNNPYIAGEFTIGVNDVLDALAIGLPDLPDVLGLELLRMPGVKFGNTDEDDVPEIDETETRAKTGDVWKLGDHVIACGNHMDMLQRILIGQQYDLLVTDPPYGVGYADKNKFLNAFDKGNRCQEPIGADHLSEKETAERWAQWFDSLAAHAKPGAVFYAAGPPGPLLRMAIGAISRSWSCRQILIWVKNNHVLGRSDYNFKHEPIVYGWKLGAPHYFAGSGTTVWEFDRPQSSKLHPTMKPVELMRRCVEHGSRHGELVCEPFAGSGTTIIACEQAGRRCVACEIEPRYVDAIVSRWEQFTGKTAEVVAKDAS